MKTKYASAIREGVEQAKLTRYGSVDDPFFKMLTDLTWDRAFPRDSSRCRGLALDAFMRVAERKSGREREAMSAVELQAAEDNFRRAHFLHNETSSERANRLLMEEVQEMRFELRALREYAWEAKRDW